MHHRGIYIRMCRRITKVRNLQLANHRLYIDSKLDLLHTYNMMINDMALKSATSSSLSYNQYEAL